ncbi:MAG: hypothetical protein LBR70_00125 [Lactobacillaceae bacterium]|nr:hypothetical protein [Lactobacillaceae bacterium]
MKTKNFISVLVIMVVTMFSANSLFGQTRVALKGSAYMVSDNSGNYYGLEVGGKLVQEKVYVHISTADGETFVLETKNGTFKLCDETGSFLFKQEFAEASVVGDVIRVVEKAGAEPKFYDAETLIEKEVEGVNANFFMEQAEKNGAFNPTLNKQRRATAKAAELSSLAPSHAKFEIRTNERGKQDLIVDGKVLFTAKTFENLSTVEDFNRQGAWFFIVMDEVDGYKRYGTYGLAIWMKDGKKYVEHQQFVPYEYSYIEKRDGLWLMCSKSGVESLRTWVNDVPKK